MKNRLRNSLSVLVMTMLLLASVTRAQNPMGKAAQAPTPQAGSSAVTGSGTAGRLSKWLGVSGSSTYVLGDTGIFEDKFGNVGIGTTAPTSKLTVQGWIETTLGGYKFPDGSVQTTAAVSGLQTVFHDATLKGNGTQASPLGVAVPLVLSGVLSVINTDNPNYLSAIFVRGSEADNGGEGIASYGGKSTSPSGGIGGIGLFTSGGPSPNGFGGIGIFAGGGDGPHPGPGMFVVGGFVINGSGFGADGIEINGGTGRGAGNQGGAGIRAFGGNGLNGATDGPAGLFVGEVEVQGSFNVTGGGTKNFKIDHPLDPENKYLYHAAIESFEVLNVYSGNVTTDESGEAVVALPEWFEAINKDFRYQLTVVGQFAQAIVAEKVKANHFSVKTSAPNVEVSWQVTGVRSDAAMRKRPFKVEESKPESERGYYLSPEAYDQPEERSVEWARHPQVMRQRKQQLESARARQQD